MAVTAMLIGAAAGAGKDALIDTPREAAQSKAKAEIMRWSPWTHLDPSLQKVTLADPFADAINGAQAGYNINKGKGVTNGLVDPNTGGNTSSWAQLPSTSLQPTSYRGITIGDNS